MSHQENFGYDNHNENDEHFVLNQSWQQFNEYWDTESARNGAIAGAVGGAVAGILASIIIAVFLWCIKKKKLKNNNSIDPLKQPYFQTKF